MFSENRGVTITIILVVIISITALIAVLYSLVIAIRQVQFGEVSALQPDREVDVLERDNNYNFAIPTLEVAEEVKTETEQTQTSQEPTRNYNFPIGNTEQIPEMASIQIPTINYNSPIIISDDGDSAIDYGAWHYPSNHPKEGEAIFLCHRRYFKSQDPKSCWNLDKVKQGASLYINYKDGSQDFYKIESISVATGDDINIYHATDEKIIKLISCAKSNGKIGSDSHRIIVIARAIN